MEYMKDHPDFVDEPTPISKNRKQFIEEYVAMHQLHDKWALLFLQLWNAEYVYIFLVKCIFSIK